eukprot:Skav229724  [mRNA]  locus=scaffold49:372576:374408:- [translate_table: standard]
MLRALAVAHLAWAAQNFLDCDESWSSFRGLLQQNAQQGFPREMDLAVEAQQLIQQHSPQMEVDGEAAYGASLGMRQFLGSCNQPPYAEAQNFCLYGVVSALWVIARHDHPDRRTLLMHANFLLGSTMNHVLDFTESSGWPISLVDILANLEAADKDMDFLLPPEVRQRFEMPKVGRQTSVEILEDVRVADQFGHPPIRLEIWEVGVHASLSAEVIQMLARVLSVHEFKFRNLIKDQYPLWLPEKCKTLYWHPRMQCSEPEDEITELFRRRVPLSASSKEAIGDMDSFVAEFEKVAGSRLNYVDILVCTVPYLCLLLEPVDLPTLGYFGHPLLFMVPDEPDLRKSFWERFSDMSQKRQVEFGVSDPFLQMQFEYQLGAPKLPVLRTHALYTGATHFPQRNDEVLVLDRPHEAILMCTLQHFLGGYPVDWPVMEGRLRMASSTTYPFRFITRAMTDKEFSTFAQFRAVVLWPYDMDLITFYEFYGMNMPIFMPKHLSKYIFHQGHGAYKHRWDERKEYEDGTAFEWVKEDVSPFDELSPAAAHLIVGYSDYFRYPGIQYFESIPELLEMLPKTNFFELVQVMSRFNHDSLGQTLRSWRTLVKRATGFEGDFF